MDEFNQTDTWKRRDKVLDLLARNIGENRLVVVLGAGASMGCGLPSWGELVRQAHEVAQIPFPTGKTDNQAIENLAASIAGGVPTFMKVMSRALYSIRDPQTSQLIDFVENSALRSALLEAVCAVVMLSCRRGHGTLVTYNFDDLVETYLARRGIFAYPYSTQPAWFHGEDVSVLHPHGFLSRRPSFRSSETITITGLDFDRQTGNIADPWRARLLALLQSSTPLFIGLSGNDQNLTSVLAQVKDSHVSLSTGRPYWGIRLCTKSDNNIDLWKNRGVWCETFETFDEIPDYLMSVCARSADLLIEEKLR